MKMLWKQLISSVTAGTWLVSSLIPPTLVGSSSWARAPFEELIAVSSMKQSPYLGKGFGVLSAEKLRAAGVQDVKTLANDREMTLVFLGHKGEVLRQFVWQRTPPKNLEYFRPSKFRQWAKTLKTNAGSIAGQKLAHFPFEALSFFSALGAINTYDLVFHYQDNPMATSQFIKNLEQPMTHAGFAVFMMMNGLSSEPLQEVIRSRRLNYFIPYFGMSVGMLASSAFHDFLQSKTLRACAAALNNGDSTHEVEADQKCDEAWDEMNRTWNDRWGTYATSWLSMMGSTLLGGAADWIRAASAAPARRILQFAGLEMAFSFTPAGFSAKAVRFAWTTVKNVQFLALDFWLRQPIENLWMNAVGKGPQLQRNAQCLGALHEQLLSENSISVSRKGSLDYLVRYYCPNSDLNSSLIEFNKVSQEWRTENLKEVLAAHQNWQSYLASFASNYRSARLFYLQLTDQIWKKTFSSQKVSPLDQINPYFGILPEREASADWSVYLQDMTPLIPQQKQTLKKTAQDLQSWIETSNEIQKLSLFEQNHLREWIGKLNSSRETEVISALEEMNRLLPFPDPVSMIQFPPPNQIFKFSDAYLEILNAIAEKIGRPTPTRYAGEAFLKGWSRFQGKDFAAQREGKVQGFPAELQWMATPSIPEYLVASMAWGPDLEKGENIIDRKRWGGFVQFQPPRILLDGDFRRIDRTQLLADQNTFFTVFTTRLRHSKCDAQQAHCDQPLWNWIRAGWIRPEVMDKTGNHMAAWWESKVEPAYLDAWYDFEVEYEKIIQEFAGRLFAIDQSVDLPFTQVPLFKTTRDGVNWANSSGFSNAALPQLTEEQKIYLLFLNDLLTGTTDKSSMDQVTVARPLNQIANNLTIDNSHPAVSAYLSAWQDALHLFPNLQSSLENQMDPKKGVLLSRVPNTDIEKSVQKLEARLNELAESLKNSASASGRQELQKTLLTLLKGNHQELLDYGLILNAASYVETHNSNGQVRRQRCMQVPGSAGASQFRGRQPGCP